MPGVSRVNQDTAGSIIAGAQVSTVFVNTKTVAVVGDSVIGHGLAPHIAPTMAQGSNTVFAEGKKICRSGDLATCGHAANGSSNVFAG